MPPPRRPPPQLRATAATPADIHLPWQDVVDCAAVADTRAFRGGIGSCWPSASFLPSCFDLRFRMRIATPGGLVVCPEGPPSKVQFDRPPCPTTAALRTCTPTPPLFAMFMAEPLTTSPPATTAVCLAGKYQLAGAPVSSRPQRVGSTVPARLTEMLRHRLAYYCVKWCSPRAREGVGPTSRVGHSQKTPVGRSVVSPIPASQRRLGPLFRLILVSRSSGNFASNHRACPAARRRSGRLLSAG